MKKLLMFALLLFWTVPAVAQVDTAWVRKYNGPGDWDDVATAIAVDGFGNVYVTGYSDLWYENADYATIKYYPNGDTAWVRRYNGPGNIWGDNGDAARDIAVDVSGNVYVTGTSCGIEAYCADYATIKYYPNGDTAWVRRYNGPATQSDEATAIVVDGSGNVYVTGGSEGPYPNMRYDYATIKYYPNGDTAWVRRYTGPGNSDDGAKDIAVDNSGNIYVTGYSYGSGTSCDYATIKYYPNGDTAWIRRYNGPGNSEDYAVAIDVDGSGSVYVTGYSGIYPNYDYATIKYHPNGDTVWVRRYNGPGDSMDCATAIALDSLGNVYVTGEIDYGWGNESGDYATIKYYPNGDTAWVRTYNGPADSADRPTAIAVDASGNVYVTGWSFGSGTSGDIATLKYSLDGTLVWVHTYNGPDSASDAGTAITLGTPGNIYVTGDCGHRGYYSRPDYVTIKYKELEIAPPTILDICPSRGPSINEVPMSVAGFNFDSLASIRLMRTGIPGDSLYGTDVVVLSYGTKIICRFDLAGQPVGSVWNLIVTNPNRKADTLYSAFRIVSPPELSTKDVFCVLSSNHERIQDFQANAKAWSKFNGQPLDSIIHSLSLYKSPDKVKNIDYANDDTTQVISTVINRGWLQYEVDPATGEAYETNLLQVANMTSSEFAGLNFYDPDNFLYHHYVSVKEIHQYPDSLIFVLEAIPKRAEWTYSKLELEIDYSKGLVVKSTVYSDTVNLQTVTVTEEQLIDGVWVGTKSIKTTADTSETLQTEIQLSNIQINVGIPDSIFYPTKIKEVEIEPESTYQEVEMPPLPKYVSDQWKNPNVYKPNPILFLHGFGPGKPASWEYAMQIFRDAMDHYYATNVDWYVFCPNFQVYPGPNASIDGPGGWGEATCQNIVAILDSFNRPSIPSEYRPWRVNIVAHSAGGLGARECVTEYAGYHNLVDKIITVGTPHLGSELAHAGQEFVGFELRLLRLGMSFPNPWVIKAALVGGALILSADLIFKINPAGAMEMDMEPTSLFYQDLYSRPQYENQIKYYAIAGEWEPSWAPIFGPDDWVVSVNSQLGIGEPGGYNFRQYVREIGKVWAMHISIPYKGETYVSVGHIKRFLDPKPNVVITSPHPTDELAEACTLITELHDEYLPATTWLEANMTKVGTSEPIFSDMGWLFEPDTNWRAVGANSIKSGRYETIIALSKAPPGKYRIKAKVMNPAGLKDSASVEIILGVDLTTDIRGGPARRGFNKDYGITYTNIGNAEASNVKVEAHLPTQVQYVSSSPPGNLIGNTVEWNFGSLGARAKGNVSVTVYIPPSVPLRTLLCAISHISTTDDDVDLTNNQALVTDQVVGSVDPNYKQVEPTGIGNEGYIKEGEELHYTVFFENVDTATAEAVNIIVVDTLDPNLNWNSLRFGPMSHPDKCSTSFDSVTGVITWQCDSIMLPPDTLPPTGEGWVTFSVSPQYLQHGTQIKNRASIQFDVNPWMYAPMDSSYIINTMDEYPPNSRVLPLWDTVSSIDFEVNWKGQDDSLGFGCGIKDYTIYVSNNGGPYEVWIADTSDTFATYHGQINHSYCFYSIAEDSVGNIEESPLIPDACTRTLTYIRGDVNSDGVINVTDVVYLINYLFLVPPGPAPQPLAAGDANCDGTINVTDVVYLINYLFLVPPGPPPGC
jgi:uncharacterized repeat protein (TIGR01451 family)